MSTLNEIKSKLLTNSISELLKNARQTESHENISENLKFKSFFSPCSQILSDYFEEQCLFSIIRSGNQASKYQNFELKLQKPRKKKIYNQINFLEGLLKESYFPRESLKELCEFETKNSGLLKIRANRLVNLTQNSNSINLASVSSKGNSIDLITLNLTENFLCNIVSKSETPEFSTPEIMELNQFENNDINYIDLRSSNYIIQCPIDSNTTEINYSQNYVYKNFLSELLSIKTNNIIKNERFVLTANNQIWSLKNDLKSIIIDNKQKIQDQIFAIENSFHPKSLFLMTFDRLYFHDYRESIPNVLNSEKNGNYSLKHYYDQYFFMSHSQKFDLYDFRSTKKPIWSFRHNQDENPPTNLIVSYNEISNYDSLFGFSNNKKGLLTGININKKWNCNKNQNNLIEKLSKIIEYPSFNYNQLNEGDENFILFTSNLKKENVKNTGVYCKVIDKDIKIVFCNDSDGTLTLQIIKKEEGKELKQIKINKNIENKDNFITLLTEKKLFSTNEFNSKKIFIDNNSDEELQNIEIDEDSFEKKEKNNNKNVNLERFFRKIILKAKKPKKKLHKEEFLSKGIDNTLTSTQDEIYKEEKKEIKMDFEELIFNQTNEDLLAEQLKTNKKEILNKDFRIDDELINYLNSQWDG